MGWMHYALIVLGLAAVAVDADEGIRSPDSIFAPVGDANLPRPLVDPSVVPAAYAVDADSGRNDGQPAAETAESRDSLVERAVDMTDPAADADSQTGDSGLANSTEAAANVSGFDPSSLDLEAFRKRIAGAELEEEKRTELTEQVAAIDGLIGSLNTRRQSIATIEQRIASLPERAAAVASEAEEVRNSPRPAVPEGLDRDGVAAELLKARQLLADAEANAELAAGNATKTAQRLTAVRTELDDIDRQRQKLDAATPAAAATGLGTELAEIKRRVRSAELAERRQSLEAEERLLLAEQAAKLDDAVLALARDRVAIATDLVAELTRRSDRMQAEVAAETARETRQQVRDADSVLRPFAEENERLAEELVDLNRRKERFESERRAAKAAVANFTALAERYRPALAAEEIDELDGLRLRSALFHLPDTANLQEERSLNAARTRELQVARFHVETDRQELGDPEDFADTLIAEAGEGSPLAERRIRLVESLTRRAVLLSDLDAAYAATIEPLADSNAIHKQLIDEVTDFRSQTEAAVLWVQSNPSILESDWTLSERARVLLDPTTYLDRARLLYRDVWNHPIIYALSAAALFILLVARTKVWSNCDDSIRRAKKPNNTSLRPYVRILLATIALSIFWPIVIGFIGYRLDESGEQTSTELAGGLFRLALLFFTLEFVRHSCRPSGLVELLQVEPAIARYVRRKVLWLEWIALPLSAVILVLHEGGVSRGTQLGERLCFFVSMIVLALFLHKLVRARSPIVTHSRVEGTWLSRYRVVVHAASIAIPLGLGCLSLAGYHFAALRMAAKLQQSLWLGLGVLVSQLLLVRMVTLHRRRLAISAMRARVNEDQTHAPANGSVTAGLNQPPPVASDKPINQQMSEQLARLIGTILTVTLLAGLYLVWVDFVPSLRTLSDAVFYTVEGSDGDREIGPADIALAIVIAVLAFTAARNLPGLLEFTVLERLGLDRSVRYAVTTIASYVIAITGIVLTGKAAGFAWQNVQWLAAGLTVGLGFGLQEIFANFISGLIIFLEQPVRVGDTVTIGDVTGSVSRIRIRATTITNFDRKEYIVPNREFITGRLLNWTLSDQTNRVVVNVGVAYGSDVRRVRQLILDVAREHPEVMEEPAPVVTFEEFGDSSLNFVLRCYLPKLDNRLATIHELHESINDRFGEVGIEIPFPQRDLNVRQVPVEQIARLGSDRYEPVG